MGKKILIVDDNEKNRKLLRILFQKYGYETVEAEDGEEAVEMAKKILPDIILMDVRMPVLDGIRASRIIKSEETTKRIPIVIVTSSATREDRSKITAESGADGYFAKPINIKQVVEMVKQFIGPAEKETE